MQLRKRHSIWTHLFFLISFILVCLTPPAQALELPVGEEPESVAINSTTNQAVVTHEGSKDLRIIDLSSNTVINTISFTSRPVDGAVNL